MTILIYLLTLLGLVFRKNKAVLWIEILAMTLLYGGYNGTKDLDNYKWQYLNHSISNEVFQKLYSDMGTWFYKWGFRFETYHLIITFLSLIILALVITKMTEEPAYVMSLVSVFVYVENGWQLKTMIATSIIAIALYWYYKKIYSNSLQLKNVLIYTFLILLAAQFHFLALFFLLFLIMPVIKNQFIKAIAVDIILFLVMPFALNAASLYIFSLTNYLVPISWSSFVLTITWHLIGYIIIAYNSHNDINYGEKYITLKAFILDGSRVMLLLMPFYYYANVASRIYRVWIIFMAIYISFQKREKSKVSVKRLWFDVYIFASYFIWFYLLFKLLGLEPLFINLISNNKFFN